MNAKIKSLQEKLNGSAILVSKPEKIIYLTNFNGFSKEEREGFLLITRNKKFVITDSRYQKAVKMLLPKFIYCEITSNKSFSEYLNELRSKEKIKKILIDENNLSVFEYKKLQKYFKNISNEEIINKLRAIKEKSEINQIKKACKISDLVFKQLIKDIKPGVSEIEIAKKIERLILDQNATYSFNPIVAFGNNSASPHHVPTNTKLKNNSIVLLDFGVKYNNYCSDMTRTLFFGKATVEFKKMYKTVYESQKKATEQLNDLVMNKKQIKGSDIDKISRAYISSQNYSTIPHSLGHGIGLEVHESPRLSPKSKDLLTSGMVFSIEPGIYKNNLGGVRIEDLFALTSSGLKKLTNAPVIRY